MNSQARGRPVETARLISLKHGIGMEAALELTESVWAEARGIIRNLVGARRWQTLSFSDKAMVCQCVVKALLDRKRLSASLSTKNSTLG